MAQSCQPRAAEVALALEDQNSERIALNDLTQTTTATTITKMLEIQLTAIV